MYYQDRAEEQLELAAEILDAASTADFDEVARALQEAAALHISLANAYIRLICAADGKK